MSEHAKYSPRRFHPQAEAALADPVLRQNSRGAMDYLRAKRRDAFADPAEEAAVRNAAEQIRQRCLSRLPDLLRSSKPTASATASGCTGPRRRPRPTPSSSASPNNMG